MSESTEEAIELPEQGDAAFGALMDALAPEEDGTEDAATDTEESAAAGATDSGAAAATPTAGEATGAPADGAEAASSDTNAGGSEGAATGDTQQPAATAGAGARPEDWTVSAAELSPKLGELSNSFEERTVKAFQQTAFDEIREEHSQYFEALEKHPRLLVGQEVPAIGREGVEVLRDTDDAREWQEAVKSILTDEIRERATKALDDNREFLETVHSSIELFQKNNDLIPGTKEFNVELANQFAKIAEPYELRVDGKLQGYSIPVQPIIDQLRTQLAAKKTTAAPSTAAPAAKEAAATTSAAASTQEEEAPQAGITSKAGSGEHAEDFSTLFGTLGLPNLRI